MQAIATNEVSKVVECQRGDNGCRSQ